MSAQHDTIFALSSGAGRAGIAVFRLSGPQSAAAVTILTGGRPPPPRRARLVSLLAPGDGALIDRGIVIWLPGPATFSGEDMAEFHVHGGRAVVAAVTDALAAIAGLRPAEAGEFTRRAFDNDRLDLTQVEGLADVINAETEAQRRQAVRQMEGALGVLYEDWRARLIRLLAHAEAEIDFPDEAGTDGAAADLLARIAGLTDDIRAHLDDGHRGERLRDGVMIAIVGAPNTGKSTLLNQIARRDVAIVSTTAGTTRDVIEVHLDLGGFPVTVADTAGLRAASGDIEAEGIRRARHRAASADLRLAVFDATAWPEIDSETKAFVDDDTLVLINKRDLAVVPDDAAVGGQCAFAVSATTGDGLAAVLARLEVIVAERLAGDAGPSLTRARHRRALEDTVEALERAKSAALPELAAEDLRLAGRALGRITGRVDVEDLLDVIFADFCIGK
ncbi:MAG: tRNA uridine-5-carboxymethylaminomethyl(34) synthesis GTPase MnmE [Alphaproteobacteria bacterium]|nr:tRNA uridine-5-carboxymethylaminomethyl(34) synthesis GTPase MnmE [Alphaproteobacteria bacterium]